MTEKITKELLEKSLKEHDDFIKMVCLNKYGYDNREDIIKGVINYCNITDDKQKELLESGKFIPAGSILSACNNPEATVSFSNCYLTKIEEDSMDGIFNAQKNLANTFKYRGGSGFDITILRPKNTKVNNAAKTSSGAVSFMPSFSEVGRVVGTNGRRAAMICTMDLRHPDALDFIWCKAAPEKVFAKDVFTNSIPDISSMNISLKVPDSFITAVKNDDDWIFYFPDFENYRGLYDKCWDGDYDKWAENGGTFKEYYRVKAKDILSQIAEAAWICGDPGVFYIDTVQKNNFGTYIHDSLKPISCNPCQPGWATVLTKKGISTFNNINIGDEIWSEDGWVKVTNKINNGIKNVFKYSTTSGAFYGTENHRIKSYGKKIEVDKAETIDNIQLNTETSCYDIQAIMDGLLIGDGSVHGASNNLIHLCVGEKDNDYFDSEIKNLFIKHRPELHSTPIAWEVKTDLTHADIPKTYDRKVPDKYKFAGKDIVVAFLKGLFSANGCVLEDYGRITLKASSFQIIEDVQMMLSSVGIGSYYTTNKSKEVEFYNGVYNCKQSYDLNITSDSLKFERKIGFLQKYKQEKLKKLRTVRRNKFKKTFDIKEKIYISTENVFDITVDGESHTYWSGGLNVSNCGEQTLSYWNNCLLGAFVLTEYMKNEFDWDSFTTDVKTATILMNHFSDINEDKHPLQKQRDTDKFGKRIGIEFTGLGDVLAKSGIIYGSNEAIEFCKKLSKVLLNSSLSESLRLAKENGPCEALNNEASRKNFVDNLHFDIEDDIKQDIVRYGLANCALLTVGPTGTLSIISGNVTSGLEPLFRFSYKRKNRIDGKEYSFIHLPAALYMIDNIEDFKGLTLVEAKNKLHYIEADEIPWEERLNIQAALQKNIDSSISSTINLPNNCTKQKIEDIYIKAWEKGLKGVTVFRDGCKQGVLSGTETKEPYKEQEIYEKELLDEEIAVRHRVMWKRSKLYVNVSTDEDNNPIEIFTKLPKESGIDGDGKFSLPLFNERNSNWDLISRLISLCLRYGISLDHIIEQLEKSSYSIVDAASILKRILSKYKNDDDNEMMQECPECGCISYVLEGGCGKCTECGYSECG